MINKKCVYFVADKCGRIFIFDEKPSLMVDMERQTMFGPPQNLPYWVVERNEVGPFGRSVIRQDFGIMFPRDLFYKIYDRYLNFDDGPLEVEC
jgi:hypothetical protein